MIDRTAMTHGSWVQRSASYGEWGLPGFVNGSKGMYEIGIDMARFDVPTITHRFFRPGAG
jgi:hypothetical protein